MNRTFVLIRLSLKQLIWQMARTFGGRKKFSSLLVLLAAALVLAAALPGLGLSTGGPTPLPQAQADPLRPEGQSQSPQTPPDQPEEPDTPPAPPARARRPGAGGACLWHPVIKEAKSVIKNAIKTRRFITYHPS